MVGFKERDYKKIKKKVLRANLKCSPFVRQYGIIEIYQLKSLTKGGIFMPKGQPNKRYTPEFKIKVVETMHREKLIKYVCLTFRASLPAILRKTDDKADKIA